MILLHDTERFQYLMAGHFQGEAGWLHPDRMIDSYEILVGLGGTACICEGETQFRLQRDDVLLLRPGVRHYGFCPSKDKVSFYWLHFQTELELPFRFYHISEGYELQQMMKRLLHIANCGEYDSTVCDALCYLIVQEAKHQAASAGYVGSALVGEISEYIRLHRYEPITVEKISNHFGYHPDYLGKLFRRIRGTGLKEALISGRMAAAKELLLTTELSVSEISDRLSFSTPNTFVKFFSYHEGLPPMGFRNRFAQTHINYQ